MRLPSAHIDTKAARRYHTLQVADILRRTLKVTCERQQSVKTNPLLAYQVAVGSFVQLTGHFRPRKRVESEHHRLSLTGRQIYPLKSGQSPARCWVPQTAK